jgi:hypothetical protein
VQAVAVVSEEMPATQWVRQLGASSYTDRDVATRKLLELGLEAKPALMRGMQDEDLEIRLGSHRVLLQLMQQDFDARIIAFLNATDADDLPEVPGWDIFRQRVDGGRAARELYAEMLRAESDLLTMLDKDRETLEQACGDRMNALTTLTHLNISGTGSAISEASLAALLFTAAEVSKRPRAAAGSQTLLPLTGRLYSVLLQPAVRESLRRHAQATVLRKLLIGWLDGLVNGPETYGQMYAAQLVLQYDLKEEGPKVARTLLANPGSNSSTIPYAAIALARFGTAQDIQYLLPHLEATQVFHTWSNPQLKKEPIRIQVRDAVLAMAIRLHGEDPAAYGYKLLEADEKTVYRIYTLGFLEDAERDAAFAKWKSRHESAGREEASQEETGERAAGEGEASSTE